MHENTCVLPRVGGDLDNCFAVVQWKSDKVRDGQHLKEVLRDVLTEWIKTEEGKRVTDPDDFNIGDLAICLSDNLIDVLAAEEIHHLEIKTYFDLDFHGWKYDDRLIRTDEDDEY